MTIERTAARGTVLVIDDDRDITDLVRAVLTDEGFAVSTLHDVGERTVRASLGRLEPDCILLDGQSPQEYGPAWRAATWMTHRPRRVPVIMFTGHQADIREAEAGATERARDAGFDGIISKPFDIDDLIDMVARCVGLAVPFDPSAAAEPARTAALVARLHAAGAMDIHASTRREWANFSTVDGAIVQLYWWQRDGVCYVARYRKTGGTLEAVGQFYDLDAAIEVALTIRDPDGGC